jgi:hypothetical protein
MLNLTSAFCEYGGGSLQSRNNSCGICDLFALCLYLFMLDMYWTWRGGHTLGFLRRGNGFGVDVEAAGAIVADGVGLGVTSSNTAGDDGGGDERLMLDEL